MAQPKFTPGPWSTERCTLETDHGAEWCGKLLIVGPHSSDGRYDEADAHLIAAAPDLYAVAKEARRALRDSWTREERNVLLASIDAALRKADGDAR